VLQVVSSFEHMALAQSEGRQDDFIDRALEQARFAFLFAEPEDVPDEIAVVRGAFRALVGLCDSGLIEPLGPFGTIFIVVVLEKMTAQARLNVSV
jgi:hypothetical protein